MFEIPDGDSDRMRTPRDIYQYICDKCDVYEWIVLVYSFPRIKLKLILQRFKF